MPKLGFIMPNMGTVKPADNFELPPVKATNLGDALFTGTQQRVLALLFGQPARSFFANELIALTGSGSGAVQRELKKLTESGLVNSTRLGNQRHFQANANAPIFEELKQIVQKTFGVAEPLKKALAIYEKEISCAFIFGSIAKRQDTASSDIDVLIVSNNLSHADLANQLLETEVKLGRRINTTIYSSSELQNRIETRNSFVTRILEQPKIWILGNESKLRS